MLKVQSFPITDSDGINVLLSQFRLATGAHILVSDGTVCIPYEDGEPETPRLKIVSIKEQKNALINQMAVITHSQKVVDLLIADIWSSITALSAKVEAETANQPRRIIEDKLKQAQDTKTQLENQSLQNKSEVNRLQINLDMFDMQIAELKA